MAVVILAELAPEKRPRLGMGAVQQAGNDRAAGIRISETHEAVEAALGAHQQIAALQLSVVFAVGIHRRPDGDHHLDAKLLQFAHHGRRVGPVGGVELPFPHLRPMQIVDHDDRHGQAAAFVLAGHGQQLVLRPVAQLALPKTGGPGRQHWDVSREVGVTLHDAGAAFAGQDHVVDEPRGLGDPPGLRTPQLDAADGGIVPEQSVAAAGN